MSNFLQLQKRVNTQISQVCIQDSGQYINNVLVICRINYNEHKPSFY
jgi:hypothetical protein